ncbi:hypothetical protein [Tellurirhabdus bombi]|uniref:hypothetical protein n=1 Tax=Tellurirhabdus bombi TaxID=2907205 RepID=UPI001F242BC7|nr:hypothetical protein [Tellurirhabdus bombi]
MKFESYHYYPIGSDPIPVQLPALFDTKDGDYLYVSVTGVLYYLNTGGDWKRFVQLPDPIRWVHHNKVDLEDMRWVAPKDWPADIKQLIQSKQ